MLQGSEDYRAVERLNLDLPSAQPVLIALLPAGGQAPAAAWFSSRQARRCG
jgi:hypothetical protein